MRSEALVVVPGLSASVDGGGTMGSCPAGGANHASSASRRYSCQTQGVELVSLRKTAAAGSVGTDVATSQGKGGPHQHPPASRFWTLQALCVSYFCVALCLILGAAVCAAGVFHRPPILSLVAIGFDMLLDMLSSCAVIWRFQGQTGNSTGGAVDAKGVSKRRGTLTSHEEETHLGDDLECLESGLVVSKDLASARSLSVLNGSMEVFSNKCVVPVPSICPSQRFEGQESQCRANGTTLGGNNSFLTVDSTTSSCSVYTPGSSAAIAHRERVGTLIVGVLFILMSVWVFAHSALEVYAHHLACSSAATEEARALLRQEAVLSAQVTLVASLPCGLIFGVLAIYKFLIASKLSSRVMRADARNSAAGALLSVTAGVIAALALTQFKGGIDGVAGKGGLSHQLTFTPPSRQQVSAQWMDFQKVHTIETNATDTDDSSNLGKTHASVESPLQPLDAFAPSDNKERVAGETSPFLAMKTEELPPERQTTEEEMPGSEAFHKRLRPRLASATSDSDSASTATEGAVSSSVGELHGPGETQKVSSQSEAPAVQPLPPSYDGIAAMVLSTAFFFEGVLSLRHLQKM